MVKGRLTRPYHRFGPAAAHPRWARLGAAALATLFMATGFGLVAELFAGRAPDSTLHLTSVSATQLDQLGIKLVATRPPPYCALSDAVNDRGWAQRGLGGCPISRHAAEKDAMTGGNATVVESALGRATMPRNDNVGQNHLVWVFVVQNNGPRMAAATCPMMGPVGCFRGPRLLLLDGQTGAVLYVTWAGGMRPSTLLPRSVPIGRPPTLPAQGIQAAAS